MFSLVVAAILGYLLGSFPTAYLVVKWKSKLDIRFAGSGNVGTLNSYEVTGSRAVGLGVLFVDVAKGAAAVFAGSMLGSGLPVGAAAAIGAVVGHNFPVWLRFRGGRGLATAAGAMLVLAWPLVVIWCAFWSLGFLLAREVNIGNAVATVLSLLVVQFFPVGVLNALFGPDHGESARLPVSLLLGVILVRLVEPVRDFLREKKRSMKA